MLRGWDGGRWLAHQLLGALRLGSGRGLGLGPDVLLFWSLGLGLRPALAKVVIGKADEQGAKLTTQPRVDLLVDELELVPGEGGGQGLDRLDEMIHLEPGVGGRGWRGDLDHGSRVISNDLKSQKKKS